MSSQSVASSQVLQLLADNPYIVMDEHFEGNEDRTEEPEAGVDVKVWGNVVAFVERLDDEHFKSLQVWPHPLSSLHFWMGLQIRFSRQSLRDSMPGTWHTPGCEVSWGQGIKVWGLRNAWTMCTKDRLQAVASLPSCYDDGAGMQECSRLDILPVLVVFSLPRRPMTACPAE